MNLDKYIAFDVETYSEADLRQVGAYAYAKHPSTDVLCVAYAFGEDEPELWRPGMPVPERFVNAWNEGYIYSAWNVQFDASIWEYVLAPKHGWPFPPLSKFMDDAIIAAYNGVCLKLETAAQAVGAPPKDKEGHDLMMKLCKPARITKNLKDPKRHHTPENLRRNEEYCLQDVRAERGIIEHMPELSPFENKYRYVDHLMNRRGLRVDLDFAKAAQAMVSRHKDECDEEVQDLTCGEVDSAANHHKLTPYLQRSGLDIPCVDKLTVRDFLAEAELTDEQRRLLELREQTPKPSTSKFGKMLEMAEVGGPRLCGTLALWGAHTGRHAGRLIQPQNLSRGFDDVNPEHARQLILAGDYDELEWFYGRENIADILAGAVRWAFVPDEGKEYICSDYSSIEGRTLAWLSGEQSVLESYRNKLDMYVVNAAGIYHVKYDAVTKEMRFVGKVGELSLGYQGGEKAFVDMAHKYGVKMSLEEGVRIKNAWRATRPRTVAFWADCQDAAITAWKNPGMPVDVGPQRVRFQRSGKHLYVRIPSGRVMTYRDGSLAYKPAPWDPEKMLPEFRYMGLNSFTRRWQRMACYGGLWAENITQAVARDIMASAMIRMHNNGVGPVLTVHDEILAEQDVGSLSVDDLNMLLLEPLPWAKGLPIAAAGWKGAFYRK